MRINDHCCSHLVDSSWYRELSHRGYLKAEHRQYFLVTSRLATPWFAGSHDARSLCNVCLLVQRNEVLRHSNISLSDLHSPCRIQMDSSSNRVKLVKLASSRAAAAVLAILAVTCQGRAVALDPKSAAISSDASSSGAPMPIYFGNGCFWGRQKDYIDAEKAMGRSQADLSAVVGYAGGQQKGVLLIRLCT